MTRARVEIHPAPAGAGHARQHVITAPLDHTSGATPGQILQADANGLPVDAANTDAQVALAVGLGHAQGTDTALGAVGVKNPPIDADKSLYRDSAAADALVTSTWTQIKAFLKTYFDTVYGAIALAHNRLHSITSVLDHTSGATPGQILQADANGLPIDAANTNIQVVAAVALAHARQHAITNPLDHTSGATLGRILQADANGLPVDGTNTNADIADAVAKKHTQGTDVALGAVGVKNPPIDADKSLYRDSTAGDALVTSTWAQVKAFLKTYFDTIYGAIGLAHNRLHSITSTLDHSSTATPGKMLKADANGLPIDATNTDVDVADAVSKKHTQGTDTALGAVGTKNPPIDADKSLYRDSTAGDALVTSTWTQVKAFLKTYFDTIYRLATADHTHQSTGAQAGKLDHGLALNGLGDDDHPQYIKNSLLTTQGDIIVRGASAPQRLAIGTKRFFLRANSNATALEYVRAFPFGVQGENGVDFTPWTATVTGSASVAGKTFAQLQINTGTTANSTGRARGFLFGWVGWLGMRIVWQITFYHRAGTTNSKRWFKLDTDTAGDPTGAAIGFRIDGNAAKGIVHNGTSLTVVDLATTLTDSVGYVFRIEFDGTNVYWYINEVLKGSSASVPSGLRAADHYLVMAITNGTDVTNNQLDVNWHTWVREI